MTAIPAALPVGGDGSPPAAAPAGPDAAFAALLGGMAVAGAGAAPAPGVPEVGPGAEERTRADRADGAPAVPGGGEPWAGAACLAVAAVAPPAGALTQIAAAVPTQPPAAAPAPAAAPTGATPAAAGAPPSPAGAPPAPADGAAPRPAPGPGTGADGALRSLPSAPVERAAPTEAPLPLELLAGGGHEGVREEASTPAGVESTGPLNPLPAATGTRGAPGVTAAAGSHGAPAGAHESVPTQLVEVVAPFRRSPDGSHRVTLHLRPEDLGEVHVEVQVRGGEISLHLTSDSAGTRDALRTSLPDLRAELEAGGLRAGSLDVGADRQPHPGREHHLGVTPPAADPPPSPAGPRGPAAGPAASPERPAALDIRL